LFETTKKLAIERRIDAMPRRSYRRAASARSAPYVDYEGGGDDDDDDGDDDGGEFVPGVDDVDELEGFVAEDEDDCDEDDDLDLAPPAFFQGHLSKNDQGRLLYQDDQRSFVFLSSKPLPDSWSLENPLGPGIELGWMHPPQHASRTTFELTITKQDGHGDHSWEKKLLHAQEEDDEKDGKLPATASAKSGDDDDDDAEDEKPRAHKPQPPPENGASSSSPSDTKPEATSPEKSPVSPTSTTKSPHSNLKAPPSYSLKQPPATDVKAMPKTTTTLPSEASSNVVYGVLGRQVTSGATDGDVMTFRGVFHPPKDPSSTTKLFLICVVNTDTAGDIAGATAAAASPGAAAATAAPTKRAHPSTALAVARKRSRHQTFEEEEDEEEDVDEGVEYSELIALHADNALSPEELRRKYYGGGGDGGGRPSAASRQKSTEDDDDDDDDDVGF
jgi:hypothetical protein